jgi:hypothetical protein
MMKDSWRDLTQEQRAELETSTSQSGWRILPGASLPSVFPKPFRDKIAVAIAITEPTSTGGTYLAYSAERIDAKASAVDIEPFGIIVHSSGPGPSGVFVHHGNWPDRTQRLPAGLTSALLAGSTGDHFLAPPPVGQQAGTLEDLPCGHRGAFEAVIRRLRAREDGQDR